MTSGMTEPMKAGALRRLPLILSAVIVLAAVAVMVRLGFWQLDRLGQKEVLLKTFAAAQSDDSVSQSTIDALESRQFEQVLYRRAELRCREVAEWQAVAGSNAAGQSGFAHVARCRPWNKFGLDAATPPLFDVVLGWSNNPGTPVWNGGTVTGRVSPGGKFGYRLVADPPLAGLTANAKPDPANIANNHLAYAVQWFLFALTALVIYALALRTRLRG